MYILIGLGPNSVEVPCMVWPSLEAAIEGTIRLFDESLIPGDGIIEVTEKEAATLFTSYYGGCGECWAVKMVEVQPGVPFTCWNLD